MNRRGVVHTLDSFFAAVIIVTALLYASQFPRERDNFVNKNLDAIGMQALVRLDGNGTLGRLVDSGSWDDVELGLRMTLPTGISFHLTVLDEQGNIVNDRAISNGGLLGRTIESVEYLLAVASGDCPMYRLRLQLGS